MDVKISDTITVGPNHPPVFIAGPCVIESERLCLKVAKALKSAAETLDIPVVFKASYDKANRSSVKSFRGPGLEDGLAVLKKVKAETGLPVLTDIHEPYQAVKAARVADVLQIPAFLCRQTSLLAAAAETGKPVNVKKGQFMAPEDMDLIREKIFIRGNKQVMITERGTFFGYHNLVVDMKGLPAMRALGLPVIFDATHSVQRPSDGEGVTGGDRDLVLPLARAAAGAGVDGFFMEVHPDPDRAKSDGANSLRLDDFESIAATLLAVHRAARGVA